MSKAIYFPKLLARFPVSSKLMVCSLGIGLLSAPITIASTRASLASLVTQSQNPPLTNAVQARFVGQWRARDIFPVPLTVIFTPEGKFYILHSSFALEPPVAYEFGYQINPNTQPMQLDLTEPGGQSLKTIFEFINDGQMRVELIGLRPDEPRPTAFTTGAILIEKVSNLTALPRNTQITNLGEQQSRGRQAEGKQNIGTMNRAQQAYYLENDKFSTTIEELGVGIRPETENYRYRIVPQGNQTQSVMMTAQAKKSQLRSYTAGVFVVKTNNENLTIGVICETDKPSSTPPAMPIASKNAAGEFQCPAGSHRLGR